MSHGLGNLRWDEARVRTEIGQDKAETRAKVPRGESGKSRRQRSEDERRNQASAITYGGRAGAGGAGRRRGETGAHTREGTERGYRQAAGGAGARDTGTQGAESPQTRALGLKARESNQAGGRAIAYDGQTRAGGDDTKTDTQGNPRDTRQIARDRREYTQGAGSPRVRTRGSEARGCDWAGGRAIAYAGRTATEDQETHTGVRTREQRRDTYGERGRREHGTPAHRVRDHQEHAHEGSKRRGAARQGDTRSPIKDRPGPKTTEHGPTRDGTHVAHDGSPAIASASTHHPATPAAVQGNRPGDPSNHRRSNRGGRTRQLGSKLPNNSHPLRHLSNHLQLGPRQHQDPAPTFTLGTSLTYIASIACGVRTGAGTLRGGRPASSQQAQTQDRQKNGTTRTLDRRIRSREQRNGWTRGTRRVLKTQYEPTSEPNRTPALTCKTNLHAHIARSLLP